MIINNAVLTGSFTVNGVNYITNTPTTGSNTYVGTQTTSGSVRITGSLQVTGSVSTTGTITAQTLVVQTVTSSIVYSSGSNIFGNQLTNVQKMTGSLRVTGSGNHYILGGNVGIGTSTITAWNGNAGTVVSQYSSGNTNTIYSAQSNATSIDTGAIFEGFSNNTTAGSKALGSIAFLRENTSTTALSSYTGFYTNNAGTVAERMRITASGSVLVGTTSIINPAAKLEVKGDVFITPTGSVASKLHLYNNDSTNETYIYDSGSSSTSILAFAPGGATKMVVNSSGNVGIGTSSPSSLLHIFGAGSGNSVTYTKYTCGDGGDIRIGKQDGVNNNAVFGTWSNNDVQLYANSVERMRITGGGNVVIQNNKIYGTGEYLGAIWNSNGGNTTWTIGDTPADQTSWNLRVNSSAAKSGGGSWGDSSDGRLKKDVQTIQNALDKINKLNPVTFEWINPEEHNNQYNIGGFIAQEIKEIFPQFVNEINAEGKDKDIVGENEVVYGLTLPFKFDAYIVKAIQEQQAQIEELKAQIDELKNK